MGEGVEGGESELWRTMVVPKSESFMASNLPIPITCKRHHTSPTAANNTRIVASRPDCTKASSHPPQFLPHTARPGQD